jgi:O-antigen/teichoic acid export membrane protein
LGHAFLRFSAASTKAERTNLLFAVLGVQTTLTIISFVLAIFSSSAVSELLFGVRDSSLLFLLFASTLLTLTTSQWTNNLFADQRASLAYGLNLAAALLATSFAVGGALLLHTVVGSVLGLVLAQGSMLLIQMWVQRSEVLYFVLPSFRKLLPLLRYTYPLFIVQIGSWVLFASDRFFLVRYFGPETAGRYGLVYSIASMTQLLISSILSMFFASVVRLYEDGHTVQLRQAFSRTIRLYWVGGLAFVCGASASSTAVIQLLGTREYLFETLPWVMALVGMGSFLVGIYQVISRTYDLAKKTLRLAAIWAVALLLNLALNAALIPHWGMMGAAIVTVISYLFAITLATLLRPRLNVFDLPLPKMLFHAILSLSGALLLAGSSSIAAALLLGTLMALASVVVAFALGIVPLRGLRAWLAA